MSLPVVSVVIPTHNRKELLGELIDALFESNYPRDKMEITVIDDASTDGTCEMVKNLYPQVKVIRTEKEVFPARSRDLGARCTTGEYLFFIDDDCMVLNGTITYLVESALVIGERAGIIAPIITCTKNPHKVSCAGGLFRPDNIYEFIHLFQNSELHKVQKKYDILDISYSPSAFLIRRSVYLELGGFDFKNFPIAWEEAEFALRVKRRGYRNVCVTKAVVMHASWNAKARNPIRAYYQGKSRTIFYRKYFRRKILLMPMYIFGFFLQNQSAILTLKYLHGVMDGLSPWTNHKFDAKEVFKHRG